MSAKFKGVGDRRFVTISEIAAELRVRIPTLRESGVLDACRRIPAGQLGRFELWLWEDVQQAVLSLGHDRASEANALGAVTRPAESFIPI